MNLCSVCALCSGSFIRLDNYQSAHLRPSQHEDNKMSNYIGKNKTFSEHNSIEFIMNLGPQIIYNE